MFHKIKNQNRNEENGESENFIDYWNNINGYSTNRIKKETKIEIENQNIKRFVKYEEYIEKDNYQIEVEEIDSPYIGVANVSNYIDEEKYYQDIVSGRKNNTLIRYLNLADSLNTALKFKDKKGNKTDLFVLPEVHTPIEWISEFANISKKNDMAIITGMEHIKYNNRYYNIVASMFPIRIGTYNLVHLDFHLKVHYAPVEIKEFSGNHVSGKAYTMYSWRGMNIAPYCCYELTSVSDRTLFKEDDVNVIAAIVYNRDVQYFSNIVESLSRDISCFVVQANDAKYGDSRIFQPEKSHEKDIMKFKGGLNHTSIISRIELSSLKRHLGRGLVGQDDHKKWKVSNPKRV